MPSSATLTISVVSFKAGTCTCSLSSSDPSVVSVNTTNQALTVQGHQEPIKLAFVMAADSPYSLVDVSFANGDASKEFINKSIDDGVLVVTDANIKSDVGYDYEYTITVKETGGTEAVFDPRIETEN
ncbi:hypothetical protein [Actomonas aquatica]|uniref:Cadherin domain-containing protein n=1 Tax=Actomonas aquatica TaxID=2866162 RepID=A0ABZ1CAJ9_9BACT|nr:hypothetical protein [Opitutus sp. WL0086]WRQ88327.1 hypothetical protein K1X11_002850 [Opitutus sp. WL0086]